MPGADGNGTAAISIRTVTKLEDGSAGDLREIGLSGPIRDMPSYVSSRPCQQVTAWFEGYHAWRTKGNAAWLPSLCDPSYVCKSSRDSPAPWHRLRLECSLERDLSSVGDLGRQCTHSGFQRSIAGLAEERQRLAAGT